MQSHYLIVRPRNVVFNETRIYPSLHDDRTGVRCQRGERGDIEVFVEIMA